MGMQWVGGRTERLTIAEWGEQKEHDRRHPGKVCRTCPVTTASQRELEQRRNAWAKREEWRMRWLPVFAFVVLIGCWLLGSWLLGPS